MTKISATIRGWVASEPAVVKVLSGIAISVLARVFGDFDTDTELLIDSVVTLAIGLWIRSSVTPSFKVHDDGAGAEINEESVSRADLALSAADDALDNLRLDDVISDEGELEEGDD